MDSIDDKCTPLKHQFEACFTRWYSEKFLQGDKSNDCEEAFKTYQACLRRALKEKGLTKMISEARPTIGSAFTNSDEDDDAAHGSQQKSR